MFEQHLRFVDTLSMLRPKINDLKTPIKNPKISKLIFHFISLLTKNNDLLFGHANLQQVGILFQKILEFSVYSDMEKGIRRDQITRQLFLSELQDADKSMTPYSLIDKVMSTIGPVQAIKSASDNIQAVMQFMDDTKAVTFCSDPLGSCNNKMPICAQFSKVSDEINLNFKSELNIVTPKQQPKVFQFFLLLAINVLRSTLQSLDSVLNVNVAPLLQQLHDMLQVIDKHKINMDKLYKEINHDIHVDYWKMKYIQSWIEKGAYAKNLKKYREEKNKEVGQIHKTDSITKQHDWQFIVNIFRDLQYLFKLLKNHKETDLLKDFKKVFQDFSSLLNPILNDAGYKKNVCRPIFHQRIQVNQPVLQIESFPLFYCGMENTICEMIENPLHTVIDLDANDVLILQCAIRMLFEEYFKLGTDNSFFGKFPSPNQWIGAINGLENINDELLTFLSDRQAILEKHIEEFFKKGSCKYYNGTAYKNVKHPLHVYNFLLSLHNCVKEVFLSMYHNQPLWQEMTLKNIIPEFKQKICIQPDPSCAAMRNKRTGKSRSYRKGMIFSTPTPASSPDIDENENDYASIDLDDEEFTKTIIPTKTAAKEAIYTQINKTKYPNKTAQRTSPPPTLPPRLYRQVAPKPLQLLKTRTTSRTTLRDKPSSPMNTEPALPITSHRTINKSPPKTLNMPAFQQLQPMPMLLPPPPPPPPPPMLVKTNRAADMRRNVTEKRNIFEGLAKKERAAVQNSAIRHVPLKFTQGKSKASHGGGKSRKRRQRRALTRRRRQ